MNELILRNHENDDMLRLHEKESANHILWELEGRCNLVCKYCYDSRVRNGKIAMEKIEKWIHFLKGSSYEYIHITGGEPTLHPQLSYVIDSLKHKKICLTTNLTGRMDILTSFMKNNSVYSIAVSLDSIDKTINDALRGETIQVIENIKTLLNVKKQYKSSVKIRLHTVITKANLHKIKDVFNFAKENGIEEVSAQPVSMDVNHPFYAQLALTKEDLDAVKEILSEEDRLFHSQYATSHHFLLDYYFEHDGCFIYNDHEQCDNFIDATGVLWNCPRKIYTLDEKNHTMSKKIVCDITLQCMTCLKRRFVGEKYDTHK